jgi:hypothetical protein
LLAPEGLIEPPWDGVSMENRAMDRRRFVPSSEGLEGRALLSSIFPGGQSTTSLGHNPDADVPVTWRQKQLRVEHLPYYLNQLQPGRVLPTDFTKQLQVDLVTVIGQTRKPNYHTLINFNQNLRPILTDASLTVGAAKTLSHDFQMVLSTSGATDQQVANLVDDMNTLTQIDSQSKQPVYLATNDYSLVLQTFLGIGRPIQLPAAPQIAQVDGTRADVSHGTTPKIDPRLVGTYGVGNSVGVYAGSPSGGFNSTGVTMQVIDNHTGEVLGSGQVNPNDGNYIIYFNSPLSNGVYELRVRAVDPQGHMSDPSPLYLLKVHHREPAALIHGAATPLGPLASTTK